MYIYINVHIYIFIYTYNYTYADLYVHTYISIHVLHSRQVPFYYVNSPPPNHDMATRFKAQVSTTGVPSTLILPAIK